MQKLIFILWTRLQLFEAVACKPFVLPRQDEREKE